MWSVSGTKKAVKVARAGEAGSILAGGPLHHADYNLALGEMTDIRIAGGE